MKADELDHVGITVVDIDRSIAFWNAVLERAPSARSRIDAPHIAELVGYPGVVLERAFYGLPGGNGLELMQYVDREEASYEPGTAHPGNVHVCLRFDDLDAAWRRAVDAGAAPVSAAPIRLPDGAKLAIVATPDGASLELRQPPPEGAA